MIRLSETDDGWVIEVTGRGAASYVLNRAGGSIIATQLKVAGQHEVAVFAKEPSFHYQHPSDEMMLEAARKQQEVGRAGEAPWWRDWPSLEAVAAEAVAKERERCLYWVDHFANSDEIVRDLRFNIRDGREVPK